MKNEDKTILHLCCSKVGSDSVFYADAGYNVIYVGKEIGVENYHPPENVYGIIANPPCTMFSLARTRAKTPRDLKEGMRLVKECLRIIWECRYEPKYKKDGCLKFWCIENPTGFLRQFIGMPYMTYHPFEFGDLYTKSTDLWGYFNKPKKIYKERGDAKRNRINNRKLPNLPSISDITVNKQAERRSICSPSFAKAFFKVNQ